MYPRLIELPAKTSFFLFGARHTGKTTLLESRFNADECVFFDLLDPELERQFISAPNQFKEMLGAAELMGKKCIIVDEIQKVPKLLDIVHQSLQKKQFQFILTGSSARKLKKGAANLLAGRAAVYNLFPFSCFELGKDFEIEHALQWGLIPEISRLPDEKERVHSLQTYAYTYLKEEIWAEHFIRKLEPFGRFLEVAAQLNGELINYANIARDTGVDDKTIKEYYTILEDTLIGFYLYPFQHSFRKRLSHQPKFYFIDSGITRALIRHLTVPIKKQTRAYGRAFEHFIVLECYKLLNYFQPEYRLSFLRTKDNLEIDLIIERPGEKTLFIEIKSTDNVREEQLSSLRQAVRDFGKGEAICLSNDRYPKKIDNVLVMPWRDGLVELFGVPSDFAKKSY